MSLIVLAILLVGREDPIEMRPAFDRFCVANGVVNSRGGSIKPLVKGDHASLALQASASVLNTILIHRVTEIPSPPPLPVMTATRCRVLISPVIFVSGRRYWLDRRSGLTLGSLGSFGSFGSLAWPLFRFLRKRQLISLLTTSLLDSASRPIHPTAHYVYRFHCGGDISGFATSFHR